MCLEFFIKGEPNKICKVIQQIFSFITLYNGKFEEIWTLYSKCECGQCCRWLPSEVIFLFMHLYHGFVFGLVCFFRQKLIIVVTHDLRLSYQSRMN